MVMTVMVALAGWIEHIVACHGVAGHARAPAQAGILAGRTLLPYDYFFTRWGVIVSPVLFESFVTFQDR